jgi:cellulose synthase/poly-beta-1,6-N-acetylglucosamine synthase-like glycosyltransferase
LVVVLASAIGLIAYTFVGYPAIVAALARVRPRPTRHDPDFQPTVSLIVAAYNEEDVIAWRLANIADLEYPVDRLQVIVVADGSDDGTADLARAVPGATVLHRPERAGKRAAIERGVAAADGELLVLTDANNRFTRETLRALVAPFADPTVGVVTGRKAIDDGSGRSLDRAEGLYWRYESRIKRWESAIGSTTGVAGEILAFRREAFNFVEPGTMNEDFVQAMLAALDGWRVVYAPNAVSLERASATLGDEAVRRSRLTTGRWQALRMLLPRLLRRRPLLALQVISHKGLRPLVPFALIAAAIANVGLATDHRWARVLLLLQIAFYGAALLGWWVEAAGRRSRLLYVPYYFCRMHVAALNGFRDFATRRQEAVWAKVRRG